MTRGALNALGGGAVHLSVGTSSVEVGVTIKSLSVGTSEYLLKLELLSRAVYPLEHPGYTSWNYCPACE